jgi:hypothetical protein
MSIPCRSRELTCGSDPSGSFWGEHRPTASGLTNYKDYKMG